MCRPRLKDLIMKRPLFCFFVCSFLKDLKHCNHLNKYWDNKYVSGCKYVSKYISVSLFMVIFRVPNTTYCTAGNDHYLTHKHL